MMDLIEMVDVESKKIRTMSLDISFNEILDMYENEELKIDPEFQRLFIWSDGKQSRFIESLLINLPLPPIFVVELEDGRYELIDGLQRISSYLHFRGGYPKPNDDGLELCDCDIIEGLNGLCYDDLPTALKLKLKRKYIRMEVVTKGSDPKLRYHMFKRLNTGGDNLTEQEVRNCTIRLLGDEFNKFIIELSNNEDFKQCIISLPDDKINRKYDQELILRFFTFKNCQGEFRHDVRDFMTQYMEVVSDPERDDVTFDYNEERLIFERTFKILNESLGEYAFSRVNEKGKFVSGFVVYHYEAFTLGIQKYLDQMTQLDKGSIGQFKEIFESIKKDPEFRTITTGGGKNTPRALQDRITFVEERLEQCI